MPIPAGPGPDLDLLLQPYELEDHLRQPLDEKGARSAIRMASGWLRRATSLTDWPDPVPEDLWAWALELSALVYSNPDGMASQTHGNVTDTWALQRKAEILADATRAYSGGGEPRGSFPPAEPSWPGCW